MVSPSITSQSVAQLKDNQKIILQPLHQEEMPGGHNYYPAYTTINVQNTKDDNRVFVETFLIAARRGNKKGFELSDGNLVDFERRVWDSMNHPLVLFPVQGERGELIFDHPVAPITTLEAAADPVRANIEFQKKYTVGHAKHFRKINDRVFNATYEITEKNAKKFFIKAKKKGIKLFTSPYIVRPAYEDRKNIKEWSIIHNAIVSVPAYDQTLASIKDVCHAANGDMSACMSLFASMTTPDTPDCGFCMEKALNDYVLVTSQVLQNSNKSHMSEKSEFASNTTASINSADIGTQPPAVTTSVTSFNPVDKTTVSETKALYNTPSGQEQPNNPENEEQKPQDGQDSQTKAELEKLKKQVAAQAKENEELKQRYEYDTKKASIEKIIAPVVQSLFADRYGNVDEKAYNAEVKRLMDKNLDLDTISEIVQAKYIIAQQAQASKTNTKPERASITSQVDEMASNTHSNMTNTSVGISVLKRVVLNGGNF